MRKMHPRIPEDWTIDKCYHPEYGGYVYQPRIPSEKGEWQMFIEPYVKWEQAYAFIEGVWWARENARRNQ